MANSITLSQSLVNDIAQKLTDGTATAEQVVLYTKGLNQLQTGNDFQAVAIGLSQAAVDAIDSANAQFQEDSASALITFSATATTIDTSATNAVSAINIAKDTLVATDAEISATISNLPDKGEIDESVEFSKFKNPRTDDMPNWDGVHPLPRVIYPHNPSRSPREIDHPWKAPFMLMNMRSGYTTYDGVSVLVDHELNVIDDVVVTHSDQLYTTAAQANHYNGRMPQARYQYWHQIHDYYIRSNEETSGSTDRNQPSGTSYMNQYGMGRHISNTHTFKGLHPAHFGKSTNYAGSSDRVHYGSSQCCVVGTYDKDFVISRPYNTNRIFLNAVIDGHSASYSYNNRQQRRTDTSDHTTEHSHNYQQNWGKYENDTSSTAKYPGDSQFHDTLRFSDYHDSGYGLTSYNVNTGKFMYISTETGGTSYKWSPKLFTVNEDKKLRDIALGRVEVSSENAGVTSEGVMTLQLDGDFDLKNDATVQAGQATATANHSTYDRYHGAVVLCDNDTIVLGIGYMEGATGTARYYNRYTKNAEGTDYVFDTSVKKTTSNVLTGADYSGFTTVTSNDGKYVMMFGSYYYYQSGIIGVIVRVSDGAMLNYHYNDTARGINVMANKHDKFFLMRSQSSNATSSFVIDCPYMFAKHADGTDVSNDIFGGSAHHEYNYTKRLYHSQMDNYHYNASGTYLPIYQPYNYMMKYYDTNGKLLPEYDRLLKTI